MSMLHLIFNTFQPVIRNPTTRSRLFFYFDLSHELNHLLNILIKFYLLFLMFFANPILFWRTWILVDFAFHLFLFLSILLRLLILLLKSAELVQIPILKIQVFYVSKRSLILIDSLYFLCDVVDSQYLTIGPWPLMFLSKEQQARFLDDQLYNSRLTREGSVCTT